MRRLNAKQRKALKRINAHPLKKKLLDAIDKKMADWWHERDNFRAFTWHHQMYEQDASISDIVDYRINAMGIRGTPHMLEYVLLFDAKRALESPDGLEHMNHLYFVVQLLLPLYRLDDFQIRNICAQILVDAFELPENEVPVLESIDDFNGFMYRPSLFRTLQILSSKCPGGRLPTSGKVLILAGGIGQLAEFLTEFGDYDVTILDNSPKYLRMAEMLGFNTLERDLHDPSWLEGISGIDLLFFTNPSVPLSDKLLGREVEPIISPGGLYLNHRPLWSYDGRDKVHQVVQKPTT